MMHPNQQVHLTYYYFSRCPDCKRSVMKIAYDLGLMKISELNVSNLKLEIRPIFCMNCGEDMYPEELLLKDQLSNKILNRRVIGKDIDVAGDDGGVYGSALTEEEAQFHEVGVSKQADTFAQQKDAFWEAYTVYALEKWDRICRELTIKEINDALMLLNRKQFRPKVNLPELRRDVKKYCQTVKEKKLFWREVNRELVNDIYLKTSPKDWEVEKDIKIFGAERIYFTVLHFPLPQELELFRAKHISKVIKKPQKETEMLINRLTQLELQHIKLIHRFQSTTRQLQEERAAKYNLEEKLFEFYEKQRDFERQNIINFERKPDDIRKIKEYKGLIAELKAMNRQLLAQLKPDTPQVHIQEQPFEDDVDSPKEIQVDISVLKGKTVGIIGGYRRKEQELLLENCQIIKHSGEKLDSAFYELLKKSDVIAVITNYISHAAMWEAKERAIDEGKQIVYVTSLNIKKILEEVVDKF
ncbi:DUF2325 domain-containing protein [Ectobacillus funiculus]|uniref:DUF2325 domain-containing protein n=1 Tax=Ectobacillus funiculus TaxID=137993 RepID=UPI00101BFD55|nr:DUF2325 domain-containing protein [Ectobacillus funiculus]